MGKQKRVQRTLMLPADLVGRADELADERLVSVDFLVAKALQKMLDEEAPAESPVAQ